MSQKAKGPFDIRFAQPCTALLAGSSQCGKTTLILDILNRADEFFQEPRCKNNVIYFYQEFQDKFQDCLERGLVKEFVNEAPTLDKIKELTLPFKDSGGSIVIIDDFGNTLGKDIATIFTVLSHHTNTNVFLLVQNLFNKNAGFRDISLNSTYIISFKNPRDRSQIRHFAQQFSPANPGWITQAFQDATTAPYSHVLFDTHQATDDVLRVRSNIHKMPITVYVEKPRI